MIASTQHYWSPICHWCHRILEKVGFNIRKLASKQDHFNMTSIWYPLNVNLSTIPVLVRNIILQHCIYQFPCSKINLDTSWRWELKIYQYNVQRKEHACRISTGLVLIRERWCQHRCYKVYFDIKNHLSNRYWSHKLR